MNTLRPDHAFFEEPVSSQKVYDGKIISLRVDKAKLPDGRIGHREVISHPGGVVVLAQLPNGKYLFVKQYRYALAHILLELPAGKLDPGESPLNSIKRELAEETGYIASHWEEIAQVYTAPGFCNEKLYLYKATGLTLSESVQSDEDEFIDVLELTLNEIKALIKAKQLMDAKTLAVLGVLALQGLLD